MKEIRTTLPVEEVLGEDVDLDDFAMLVQDAIQAYRKMVIDTIKNQPIAYDIDKVIEELELHSFEFGVDTLPAHYVRLNEAIEIVKQGGVSDDVCERKYTSTSAGKFIRNPHTNRLHNNEQVCCNICGKKIKAVE